MTQMDDYRQPTLLTDLRDDYHADPTVSSVVSSLFAGALARINVRSALAVITVVVLFALAGWPR
jgi:hypothetical protein